MSRSRQTDRRTIKKQIRDLVADEIGTLYGSGIRKCALVYPSPYKVAMSSLGFQHIYGLIHACPGVAVERAFLPDVVADYEQTNTTLFTYESQTPVNQFDMVAFSIAYELEITGLFECLKLAKIPILRSDRGPGDPLVVLGGPLTFSNPEPLFPFADLVVVGEADEVISPLMTCLTESTSRKSFIDCAVSISGVLCGDSSERCCPVRAPSHILPARSVILTPNTQFSNMFLIEAERGCNRGCRFCVMRRESGQMMRLVAREAILDGIPSYASKVGLVGAAVTDHPELSLVLSELLDGGRKVSVSSLRADRLTDELVGLLAQGGLRTLTVAADGSSKRVRLQVGKKIREEHLITAAKLASHHNLAALKIYQMIGLPGETEQDIDELIRFTNEISNIKNIVLTISPFVSKRRTPMDNNEFAPLSSLERMLKKIRKGLTRRVELRGVSVRWAWVEFLLAQGKEATGLRALKVWQKGGRFSDWKREFKSSYPG